MVTVLQRKGHTADESTNLYHRNQSGRDHMAERPPCSLGHDPAGSAMRDRRYEATIQQPGAPPERVVCCRECALAIYERNPDKIPSDAADRQRVQRLQEQLRNPAVKIEKPVPIKQPTPPQRSVERQFGYERGR